MANKELHFKLHDYSPNTLPMAKLAEYLKHLANFLGSEKSVHFVAVGTGSADCVMDVDSTVESAITDRVLQVSQGHGPNDAKDAFDSIWKLLEKDGSDAELQWDDGNVLYEFRQESDEEETFGPFWQEGSLDGRVVKVGGFDATIPVHLLAPGIHYSCNTNQEIAKKLGHHFYDPIRVFGRGKWFRNAAQEWELQDFIITDFEPLSDESLIDTIARLRAIPNNDLMEDKNPLATINKIRHDENRE